MLSVYRKIAKIERKINDKIVGRQLVDNILKYEGREGIQLDAQEQMDVQIARSVDE